ncbi:MAG: polysaccharide biosynthesis tyrosine autokinase [Terriglobia bacterium]
MDENELTQGHQSYGLLRPGTQPSQPQHEVVEVPMEEVRDLLDYWHTVSKRRWVVLSCLLIVFTTVAIGTLKQKPTYGGTVLVEINNEQPNVLNFKEVLQISSADVDSYRETQFRVLQSRTLADRVVQDLQLYRHPEFYRQPRLFGLFERDPETIPAASDTGPPDLSSEAYRSSVKHLMDVVEVAPVRRSNLVEVAFYSHDPQLAARVANQLAADYIEQNLQVKWDETIKASEWLSNQLVGLKAKLEKSEDALQAYAQAHSILFVEDRKNLVNARLEQLQTEYTKAQADRFQKESLYSLVQAGKVQDLPGVLGNNLIQELSVRLAELERDYAQLTAIVKPDYPKAVQLKKQIDALQASLETQKKALVQNIVDEYRSAVAREKYLAEAVDAQKKEVNDIAEKSIQYNILKREVDTNKQLYDGLLQRLKEAQVSAGLKASNIRIVDAAEVPRRPVRPRVVLNLGIGFILGLGLGIGLAFFQDYLDKSLKTPDEVETLLRLPSLGVIPAFAAPGAGKAPGTGLMSRRGATAQMAPAVQTSTAAIEAFRSLRTSILLSANPVPKLILITSAFPGEGKTSTTINLGATLASLGSRVVIVDCDMRRPACHRSTGVENKPGFVQCLTGHVDLAEALLPVPGVENLSVIPCGPIPPNPAEILSSPMAGELFQRLRSQFEYVLVDSPPLLSVADSRILSTLTDAVVLVVRAYETSYDVVRRARALLYGAGARLLGVALNNVDFRRDGYGYDYYRRYGYGYGSGYGYGYGYGEDTKEGSSQEKEA